jgi:Ca2+/Na+ antiporter
MFALARLLVIAFIFLTIVYVALSLYSRSVRRGKLAREWEEDGVSEDKDTYIKRGLEEYDDSLRRKLILGVYIVPLALVGLIIYLTNFY